MLRAERSPFAAVESRTTEVELDAVVDEFAPDLVVVSGVELFRYLDALRPRTGRLVLDLDYAQAFGLGEMARADPNRARSLLWRHAMGRVAEDEAHAVSLADQVWVSTPEEPERPRASIGDPPAIAVVPNVVDVGSYARAPRTEPGALVYTGRFDYWPNEEAARVLVQEILPRLPGASLALVGLAPPPWLTALDDPRVEVTGPVADVRPYLTRAAVMPVPLTAGAGTRFKVLEAFATGVPVVSTAQGVDGLGLVEGVQYLRAEQPDDFVDAIGGVRDDPDLAVRLVGAAAALVEDRFSLVALRHAVAAALG